MLAARLVLGAGLNLADQFRPLRRDAGFAHFTADFYLRSWQFDFKHSEVSGSGPVRVDVCACQPPLYFPTPPPHDATPDAPPSHRTETLDTGFYRRSGDVVLRTRVWESYRPIDTVITNPNNGTSERRSGRERSSIPPSRPSGTNTSPT